MTQNGKPSKRQPGIPEPPDSTPTMNAEQLKELSRLREKYLDIVANVEQTRSAFMQQYLDPRRDLNKECGYPEAASGITPDFYRKLWDEEGVATRVVNIMPDECWQVVPEVYEDEDEKTDTEFEKAWKELSSSLRSKSWYEDKDCLPIWEHLHRVDKLSGIGRFGVLLLGFDDGKPLFQPVDGVTLDSNNAISIAGFDMDTKEVKQIPLSLEGTDSQYTGTQFAPYQPPGKSKKGTKLLFLRAFDESLVQIVRYEADVTNPRFGMPVMYKITFNDPKQQHSGVGLPLATMMVHWSRVIHVADRLGSSEIFGVPRMGPSLHRLLDLAKLYGGSAEMYWKGAFPGISFETHPQLGGQVELDAEGIRDQLYQYQNDLQRFLLTTGMSAKTLSPQVVDPTQQVETQIQAVCIEVGIPQRIFMGSERGELASSEDQKAWKGRVHFRQTMYLTPRVIVPLVDRLIMVGVLPEPKSFRVRWPSMSSLTDTEKATIAQQLTTALSTYVSGGVEQIMVLRDYLVNILGMDSDVAEQIVENAMEQAEEDAMTPAAQPQEPGFDENGDPIPLQQGEDDGQEPPIDETDEDQ